jgi:hypothetical protein
MKEIVGDLGEMNILLNLDANPLKKIMYRLNRVYKRKVKGEIDKILEAQIIEHVEES